MARYDLTDFEWETIQPLLPNKPRGVPRVDDRRVLNGIFWVLGQARRGPMCRSAMARRPRSTTASTAGGAGVWDRLMDAIIAAHDGKVQMIDSTSVRVHQQAAAQKTGWRHLYRSKSWRTDHQAARPRRRQWPPGAARTVARPGQRRSDGGTPAQRSAPRRCRARRPRL